MTRTSLFLIVRERLGRIDLFVNIGQKIVRFGFTALETFHDVVIQPHAHVTTFQQIGVFPGH